MTDDEKTKHDLRRELRQARSRIRELESELSQTNEGMVALTLELENAKERYQTIFEETSEGILLIDPDQDSIYGANPQACELLGYSRDRLVSLSPEDVFPDEADRDISFAEAVVQGWADSYTCRRKDGRKLEIDISASMVQLDGRSLLLASFRDITNRKLREQRLQVLTRIFRHNLRNDGNVIQGHADILFEELADTELEKNAQTIRRTIDDVLRLGGKVRTIQDILSQPRITATPISDIVEHHNEWFIQAYPEATMSIDLPDEPVQVGQRLSVAVREAVDNSARHADGSVNVELRVERRENTDQVALTIRDDGPGVPEQEVTAMQSGSETPLDHGSGIGLWSIKWAVDSLGGRVSLHHDEPTGTVVTIVVPTETERQLPESEARETLEGEHE